MPKVKERKKKAEKVQEPESKPKEDVLKLTDQVKSVKQIEISKQGWWNFFVYVKRVDNTEKHGNLFFKFG